MQEQMNSMSDSGEFQEVESNQSGKLSHFPSHPEVIPSSSSMLSCDKRLPFNTWNTLGLQENVFGNQFSTRGSSRNPSQGIHHAETLRETASVPRAIGTGTSFARDDEKKQRHNSNADVCKKAVDYDFVNTCGDSAEPHGCTAKTANIGAAIRQTHHSTVFFSVGRQDSEIK